jgi:hypothetical protein
MNRTILAVCAGASAVILLASSAQAQWSADASNNLKVADRSGEQVQPKLARTADGGAYVSWYDNATGGYDVYIQRLNAQGVEQWPHNGVLIADRSVSSTVDYSLACDADGNAVIVFNDDRTVPQQITLQKVSPAGTLLFNGPAGINVGAGSTGGSPPTVAILADGNYGVIWNTTVSPIATNMQKVDANSGALLWNGGAPVVQADWLSPARWVQASDCQPDDAGGMIVLFVRCTGSSCVTSSKQLFTQRYNALGAPVWNGGTPVTVFAGTSSIQTATYPRFLPDGAGGAVYGWYENGSSRYAYIQHILADGSPKFAAPLASTGVTAGRIRVSVGFTYNRATGEYFEAFDEADSSTQSNHVLNVQRFSSAGALLWGNDGVPLIGPSALSQSSFIQVFAAGDGCIVSWIWQDNTVNGYIDSARVSGEGAILWNIQTCSQFTSKSRLNGTLASCGDYAMLAWGNSPSGSVDIAVQNVLFDGSIGPGTCPSFSAQPPAAAHPCQGSTLILTAAATGNSIPCLQWRKNGNPLLNGGRISGATSGTLAIANAQASDAGSYDLVASNTCGTLPSSATAVTICPADFNCDNTLSVQDIFDFLAAWFAGNPRANFNTVGGLTVQDIFDFLSAWFAGC